MMWTDDPVADAERHIARLDAELERKPRCSECKNRIQDEQCFEVGDVLICISCMDENHRRDVEDYVC